MRPGFELTLMVLGSATIIATVVALNGGGGGEHRTGDDDPRAGRVHVHGDLSKECDGATLVYVSRDGGVAVVANSPECRS